ncbi:alpha/beta hydrolase [Promicromonospora iranensis]|uniref:alpha/beta hydrolase n=1 Tax=Promicromonospora iranensis TaxID=1105144 RepID=UPI0023A9290A|nr:alpha/beta hydrolase [Promicromonospora iranensis]
MTVEARRPAWLTWTVRAVAAGGVAVVVWACVTAWGAVVHGHPAYAVLLGLTVLGCALVLGRSVRARPARHGWRAVLDVVLVLAGIGWVAALAWCRPYAAVEPALSALVSDAEVTVTEFATRVELAPAGDVDGSAGGTAVFFQPGAKVDARAYAAVLRPLAEAGHPVVIAKQPLGIAFLATGAFDGARAQLPDAERWVLGGHSLGGVVASTAADDEDGGAAPVVGLLLYASYPAGDVSASLTAEVESISASRDGLSTPDDIEASRANLPEGSTFTVVDGAVHAFFADYGPQPGDGTPTISHDEARTQISAVSTRFVDSLSLFGGRS